MQLESQNISQSPPARSRHLHPLSPPLRSPSPSKLLDNTQQPLHVQTYNLCLPRSLLPPLALPSAPPGPLPVPPTPLRPGVLDVRPSASHWLPQQLSRPNKLHADHSRRPCGDAPAQVPVQAAVHLGIFLAPDASRDGQSGNCAQRTSPQAAPTRTQRLSPSPSTKTSLTRHVPVVAGSRANVTVPASVVAVADLPLGENSRRLRRRQPRDERGPRLLQALVGGSRLLNHVHNETNIDPSHTISTTGGGVSTEGEVDLSLLESMVRPGSDGKDTSHLTPHTSQIHLHRITANHRTRLFRQPPAEVPPAATTVGRHPRSKGGLRSEEKREEKGPSAGKRSGERSSAWRRRASRFPLHTATPGESSVSSGRA
jgi:hypothetical protein